MNGREMFGQTSVGLQKQRLLDKPTVGALGANNGKYVKIKKKQKQKQNKGILTSPAQLSFVLKVPLCYLRPSVIYSVPCDRILQRAYCATQLTRLVPR